MLETLRAGWASGRITTPATRERITAALGSILDAGARSGSLRTDVRPEDVTAALLGIFFSTAGSDDPEQVGRLVELVVDGLRFGVSEPSSRSGVSV
jgi:hypothetical protein